ncbi:MAG: 2-oxo acid dehydrogenase subunit E2, partial [Chloroflexota bacterium]
GDVLPIGEPIAVIGAPDEKVDLEALKRSAKGEEAQAPAVAAPTAPGATRPDGRALPEAPPAEALPTEIKASPVARRLASEHGVDLHQVTGTGPGGRITRRDIEAYLAQPRPAPAPAPAPAPVPEAVRPPAFGEERPLSRIRQLIARRMVDAKQAPHFYVTIEVDMAGAMKLRQDANALLDDAHKLSVNDLIVKAAALALREFPRLNASFAGDKIIIHPEINIGIAVALEDGLITVVIRNADQKSLSQIAAESKEIIARTREGKNRPEDFEGITFTTSNLGMYDVDSFIAIINPPNA